MMVNYLSQIDYLGSDCYTSYDFLIQGKVKIRMVLLNSKAVLITIFLIFH